MASSVFPSFDWFLLLALLTGLLDLRPGGRHRGYAAIVDGSGLMAVCCCSHWMGDR
jgi:hypothetical protein